MYEGLFVSVFTAFESFVEELFVGLLVAGGRKETGVVVPRVTVRSYSVARQLVFGLGRRYADWLPYDQTEQRAVLFFRGGRPFANLRKDAADPSVGSVRDVLDRGVVIRNAIAHKSEHSLARFERDVLRGTPLGPRERTAAGFLRGVLAATPPETRFQSYASAVLRAAQLICN
jgi:hypothetical protein